MHNARFKDRVVFITGAGSGLGRATAKLFAAEGARVFGVDINEAGIDETVAASRSSGGTAAGGVCDVADLAGVRAAIGRAVDTFGALHILINVAAVGRAARFEEIETEEWQRVLAVNLSGPFHTTKVAMPHLLKQPGSNIVNVASTAGMRGQAYAPHYAASKAGLINFTRSIALEYASRGVRANCISPAGIATPFLRGFMPRDDFEDQLINYIRPPVAHQYWQPEDMAAGIAFLASNDAKMITGAVLVADGGTLA